MKAQYAAQDLINYWEATRGRGHTSLMLSGTGNRKDVIVMGATHVHAKSIAGGNASVSIQNTSILQGQNKPLAIDHFALQWLLTELLKDIKTLEQKLDDCD